MCGEVEGKRTCEYGRGRGREKVHEEGEGCEDVSKGVSLKKGIHMELFSLCLHLSLPTLIWPTYLISRRNEM